MSNVERMGCGCGARKEWGVARSGHLYVIRETVCICPPESELKRERFDMPFDAECQECGAPVRTNAKRCNACSAALALARGRTAPKCVGCGIELERRDALRCPTCRKDRHRAECQRRAVEKRAARSA